MGPLPLVAEGVSFRYAGAQRPALGPLDLELEAGAVLVVTGPSGSGKSTLARAIAGLIPRDIPGDWSGSLRVGDLEASTASPAAVASRVGILFQDPGSQLVMDRAEDDVAFGLENRGWPLADMRARVPQALAAAGLEGFGRRRSTRLSGGEQQRLALAGVEAPGPALLVLDEPTANLDPVGARRLFARLAELRDRRSTTIVVVEHRADLAWPLADLVLALDAAGTPIDLGSPDAVLARSGPALAAAGIWLPGDLAASVGRPDGDRGGRGRHGQAVATVRDASFSYQRGSPVVRGVDLDVAAGERVALVGPNGSGKSTLLRLVAGLLRPDHGSVTLGGGNPFRLPPAKLATMAGYVFQDPELGFLADTVAEEVRVGLDAVAAGRTSALLERLGLSPGEFGGRNPYRLSGGEQRRLSLATALVRRPSLLVLDEPTFGQDRHGWESLAAILDEHVAEGTAVVAATHDERFAGRVADRRLEMVDGRISGDGRAGPEAAAPPDAPAIQAPTGAA